MWSFFLGGALVILMTVGISYLVYLIGKRYQPKPTLYAPKVHTPTKKPSIISSLAAFTIQRDPGGCLALNQNQLIFGECTKDMNNIWTAFEDGHVQNLKTGLCLEVGSMNGEVCDFASNKQRFIIDDSGRIKSALYLGECLDAKTGWGPCINPTTEGWYPNRVGVTIPPVYLKKDGVCLGALDGNIVMVNATECNQTFTPMTSKDEYHQFRHTQTGKCLDNNGGGLHLLPCRNADSQKFKLANGTMQSKVMNDKTCLAAYETSDVGWDVCGPEFTKGWEMVSA